MKKFFPHDRSLSFRMNLGFLSQSWPLWWCFPGKSKTFCTWHWEFQIHCKNQSTMPRPVHDDGSLMKFVVAEINSNMMIVLAQPMPWQSTLRRFCRFWKVCWGGADISAGYSLLDHFGVPSMFACLSDVIDVFICWQGFMEAFGVRVDSADCCRKLKVPAAFKYCGMTVALGGQQLRSTIDISFKF